MNFPTVALDARLIGGTSTGDSTYWTGLLYGMARIQPESKILLFSNAQPPPNIPESPSFQWIHLPSKNARWWSMVRFPLAARRAGAVAIHTQYSLSPLVGRAGFTTIHDVSFFIGPEWFKPKDRFVLQRTVPAAVRRAKGVFCVSETGRRELEGFVPAAKGKTHVTFNACPPWIQRVERSAAKESVRKHLGLELPYLLTVGTRWPRKNMELAVKAAERLDARFPHRLAITGKAGWGDQAVGSRALSTGYVSNELLSALYSAADLYLAPSRHEGFGVPVLEAFRCACPVLSSSGGALPEVVDGAGVVERSWQPEQWAQTIEGLLEDSSKLESLRRDGLKREEEFTWEETARRTLGAYFGATS
ncbi:MAG TPA: glycosyltransferase family 1 protein [Fimbriimonas sp.]|nr:glycosyltransferase family 1 protein [Fimbriimonas sp.]